MPKIAPLKFNFPVLCLLVLVIIGSAGILRSYIIPAAISFNMIFLGIKLFKNGELLIPSNFVLFLIFLLTLLIHTIFFSGQLVYFWMFLSAGLMWLTVFNLGKGMLTNFPLVLVGISLIFTATFLYFKIRGVNQFAPDNLFLPITATVIHNHLGDLWAITLITLLAKMNSKSLKHISVTLLGLFFVFISHSRSALFALASGLMLIGDNVNFNKLKIVKYVAITVIIGAFIYSSITKPFLSARPYFYEALIGIISNPLGIGIGNFSNVSTGTNIVHNLILEVVLGMGIFSVVFLCWIYKITESFLNKEGTVSFMGVIWIAFLVNFFFDSTYVIPGMLWLWFITLGLSQKPKNQAVRL